MTALLPEEPFHEHYDPARPDWLVVASFTVYGVPKAQPRVKFSRFGKFGKAYTPDGAHQVWEDLLYLQCRKHVPTGGAFEGPVRVWVDMYFPRSAEYLKPVYPDSRFEFVQKPDRDNAEKKILDVFTNLGFFRDDKQVCGGEVSKWYIERGGKPRAEISIEFNQNWPYKRARVCSTKSKRSGCGKLNGLSATPEKGGDGS